MRRKGLIYCLKTMSYSFFNWVGVQLKSVKVVVEVINLPFYFLAPSENAVDTDSLSEALTAFVIVSVSDYPQSIITKPCL